MTAPHLAALRGILTACRNYGDGTSLYDAVRIHTANLVEEDIQVVIVMLAHYLATGFADIVRDAEQSTVNLSAHASSPDDDGNFRHQP